MTNKNHGTQIEGLSEFITEVTDSKSPKYREGPEGRLIVLLTAVQGVLESVSNGLSRHREELAYYFKITVIDNLKLLRIIRSDRLGRHQFQPLAEFKEKNPDWVNVIQTTSVKDILMEALTPFF